MPIVHELHKLVDFNRTRIQQSDQAGEGVESVVVDKHGVREH